MSGSDLRNDLLGFPLVIRSPDVQHDEREEVDKLLVEAAEARSNRDEWNRHLQNDPLAALREENAAQRGGSIPFTPRQDGSDQTRVRVQESAHSPRRSPGAHGWEHAHDERDEASFRVLAQECDMLRESRDNLQKRLDIALAELEDEKRLNRELSQSMSERMREVFVMLPDAKERAVMDLYKEAKKLELARKCGHEASTNFEKMRKQLARRVSNLQTAVAAESVRNKETIVTMKRGLGLQEQSLRRLLQEWEVARSELEQRATQAEAGAEAERRRMYAVVDEVVRKGISDGEVELKRQLDAKTEEANITISALAEKEMQLRLQTANLEGQLSEQQRQWMQRESELKEEVELVHSEWQKRFDTACLELQTNADRLMWQLQELEHERAKAVELSKDGAARAAQQAAERTVEEMRAGEKRTEQREKQLYKRTVEAEQQVRELQGQTGASLALLEAQAAAAESTLEAAFAAALGSSRDRLAEHRFHLSTIAGLGDKCKTLVLEKQTSPPREEEEGHARREIAHHAVSEHHAAAASAPHAHPSAHLQGSRDGARAQHRSSSAAELAGASEWRGPSSLQPASPLRQWQWAEPSAVASPPPPQHPPASVPAPILRDGERAAAMAVTWQALDVGAWEGLTGRGWKRSDGLGGARLGALWESDADAAGATGGGGGGLMGGGGASQRAGERAGVIRADEEEEVAVRAGGALPWISMSMP